MMMIIIEMMIMMMMMTMMIMMMMTRYNHVVHMQSAAIGAEKFYTVEDHAARSVEKEGRDYCFYSSLFPLCPQVRGSGAGSREGLPSDGGVEGPSLRGHCRQPVRL